MLNSSFGPTMVDRVGASCIRRFFQRAAAKLLLFDDLRQEWEARQPATSIYILKLECCTTSLRRAVLAKFWNKEGGREKRAIEWRIFALFSKLACCGSSLNSDAMKTKRKGFKVSLRACDGPVLTADRDSLKASSVLSSLLTEAGLYEGTSYTKASVPVYVPNINAPVLRKVIKWLEHHKSDPPPAESRVVDDNVYNPNPNPPNEELSPWDVEFFKMHNELLFDFIKTAHYLKAEAMYQASCQAMANRLTGKTTEEMRVILGVRNDFTPEQEEEAGQHTMALLADLYGEPSGVK